MGKPGKGKPMPRRGLLKLRLCLKLGKPLSAGDTLRARRSIAAGKGNSDVLHMRKADRKRFLEMIG